MISGKLQPLLPVFHSGESGKSWSLCLHLADKLACVLDGIDFVKASTPGFGVDSAFAAICTLYQLSECGNSSGLSTWL